MFQKYKNVETVKPGGLDLKDRLVGVQRVTKVTKGGRAFGFSAIVVVGDENGVVGHGLGKSKEVATAIAKAIEDGKKNLIRIPLNKGTLPHEQKGKFGGARVYIQPASHGTGVIAGGAVRAVLEAVGVHDVLSKSQGSSNPHNVVKATIDALVKLRSPEEVARQRGISIDKVFTLGKRLCMRNNCFYFIASNYKILNDIIVTALSRILIIRRINNQTATFKSIIRITIYIVIRRYLKF